jgi:CMP-N,N'-diacetyllegionaminic acid synthase
MRMNKILAIIPARKGSKGIENKNMQIIGGKPMIQFTMEAALNAKNLDQILVSSDDQNIIELAKKKNIKAPFVRPEKLSLDETKVCDVIIHALDWYKRDCNFFPENIILLQPTSPFRTSTDIDKAIDKFHKSSKKTLVSATEFFQHPGDALVKSKDGKYNRLNLNSNHDNSRGRQFYPETLYIDGGIYISETLQFLMTNQLIGDDPEIFITEQSHAIDIDTFFDLKVARAIYDADDFF